MVSDNVEPLLPIHVQAFYHFLLALKQRDACLPGSSYRGSQHVRS